MSSAPASFPPDSPAETGTATATACAAALIEMLPTAMTAMRSSMRKRIGGALSVPQFRCLNYIDRNPGAALGQVASFLGVTLATASAMTERLVQAGFVASAVSQRDRRRAELRCLPAGRRILSAMRDATLSDFAVLLQQHPPRVLNQMLNALQLLNATFKADEPMLETD